MPDGRELVGSLRDSPYTLTVFGHEALDRLEVTERNGRRYVRSDASDRARLASPEEIVRQLYIDRLVHEFGYAPDRISIERPVYFGSTVHKKAADIVVADEDDPDAAYIIVEVKRPARRDGEEQLKSYCNAEGSPIGVWSNGGEEVILHRTEPNIFRSVSALPRADQTLEDVLNESWTLADLTEHNKLVREQTTLKEIVLSMENLVLANAGVDAFEEVFKLIYAKLFDEWSGAREPDRPLEFRIGGASPQSLADRINRLFQRAKARWPGVFVEGDRIDLSPPHLVTCVSFLEDVRLFNSNLQVIDEAFEYLAIEVGKAKKGQYFTPRHVIDMCVEMLDPTPHEQVIDTAAGSCGFTVHAMFHVWGNEFTAAGPNQWQAEYARERVFAIDFDARSTKIAQALNLIAGDGRTNVYRANTLDPRNWSEEVRVGLRPRLRRFSDPERDAWNQENFRFFDFDVLLTNPPFAGDITDSRILHQYDIAKREDERWYQKLGRDVLFLERNMEFVRPGGRLAIVLPQGRFNNASDATVRSFVAERARILAVVGLHPNTFKPHTSTKTSVLFLQTLNEDPDDGPLCVPADDYPVFFATSERGGKDNSGNYVFRRTDDGAPALDDHGHFIVDHDLSAIAAAFTGFRERHGLEFSTQDG